MKIAVISRTVALARRARMRDYLNTSSHDWFFFDAAEGSTASGLPLNPDARRIRGRVLAKGEIGCFQSHWLLWQMLSRSADDWICVIEDDVFLDPSFDFPALIGRLKAANIHLIRLHFLFLAQHEILGRFGRRSIVRFKRSPFGTQAYLISRQGASQLLQSITEIKRPIDDEMDRFWEHRLPIVALFPFPTLELTEHTSINTREISKDPLSIADIFFRRSERSSDAAKRLMANVALKSFDSRSRAIFKKIR